MRLLPPAAHLCPICATAHDPTYPHNAVSMYYLIRFYGVRGRWPTWADAAAHCDPKMVRQWKQVMLEKGIKWTEPPEGVEPIADPPEESLHQPIGDPNSREFGPIAEQNDCHERNP